MGVKRNTLGPLIHAELTQIEEVVFWDKTIPPSVDAEDTDETYIVEMGDRPDYQGFQKLGASNLGWVIMERNEMRLWPDDFVPGRKLKVPSRDSVRKRGISQ